ncbi:ankyrin, partial [Stipitochalara longipes BDJ]
MATEPQARTIGREQREGPKRLLEAIREGEPAVDTVLQLLQQSVDVETKDDHGTRALAIAAGLGLNQIVQILLRFKAKIHINGEKTKAPLVAASSNGHINIVKLFKEGGIDEWERCQSLLEAIRNGHLPVVKELLILPKDFNYEKHDGSGIGYLAVAAEGGHFDIVSFLLSKGASQLSLKSRWTSPIHMAAEEGHLSIARLLVEQGGVDRADLTGLNANGCTPLILACFQNKSEVARYLASKMDKLDVDIRADDHFSALSWAIYRANTPLVHKLL